MSLFNPKKISTKFAIVVLATVGVVAIAGFWQGTSLINQIVSLIHDPSLDKALNTGSKALVSLHKERRAHAEALIDSCSKTNSFPRCSSEHLQIAIEKIPAKAGVEAGWLDEKTYNFKHHDLWHRASFTWEDLKPKYDSLNETLARRTHIDALLPNISQSFLVVFAVTLLLSGLLGLIITYVLGKKLAKRTTALVDYTHQIGSGELAPQPTITKGPDELGMLAEAMHTMARDLHLLREKLIYTEKLGSWQTVARKVAHEIKNPLTPISLVADEMERKAGNLTQSEKTFMEESSRILREEIDALTRMVREFSAFARLPDPKFEHTELKEVVSDFVKRNLTASGPNLIFESKIEHVPAEADRAMIHQIFHNLVNNARLAKVPHRAEVTFTLGIDSKNAIIEIIDNGPGVPESIRANLFDAYVSTRSTGDGERGMGLGLTISRKIASDHKGSLVLVSTGPQGSCFRLTLPISRFRHD